MLPTRDDFAKFLNQKFRVFFEENNATEIELIQVSELRQQGDFTSFYLAFLAPNHIPPVQKIYQMEHDSLGSWEIFLVPYQKDEKGVYFDAGFNQNK